MLKRYKVIAPFKDREANRVRAAGEELEVDEERAQELLSRKVVKELKQDSSTQTNDDGLVHVGGGYYQLPNGDKVKGKEQALEALAQLQSNPPEGGAGDEGNANQQPPEVTEDQTQSNQQSTTENNPQN